MNGRNPNRYNLGRWNRIWSAISYLLLLIATTISLFTGSPSPGERLLFLAFAVLYALWYWIFIIHLQRWGRGSPVLALSFVVMIGLLGWMSTLSPAYLVLLFANYGIVFGVLATGWAILATVILSLVAALSLIAINHQTIAEGWSFFITFGLTTIFAILFGLYISSIFKQTIERQQMIDELQSTRAELARAERQAGTLEERQRLAREIHDTLAQGFTSIVMHLEAAEQAMPPAPALTVARQHLDQARAAARESLSEARRFVWALRTEPLEHASLVQAIRRVAQHWSEESAVQTQVECSGEERPLPSAYEVTLLRSAQEALVNVRKHARASRVILTITYMEDQVSLDVHDDGQGFEPDQLPQESESGEGLGLIGMRERALQLGGSLTVESAPGEGTTLAIVLPYNPAPADAPVEET